MASGSVYLRRALRESAIRHDLGKSRWEGSSHLHQARQCCACRRPEPGRPPGRAIVRIAVEATPDPVRLIRVQVNGRQVAEDTPDVDSGGFGASERLLSVPLAKGRNEIRVTLTNAIGEKAETLTLERTTARAISTSAARCTSSPSASTTTRAWAICAARTVRRAAIWSPRAPTRASSPTRSRSAWDRATSASTSAYSSTAAMPRTRRPRAISSMRWSCCGRPGRPTPWCCSSPGTA